MRLDGASASRGEVVFRSFAEGDDLGAVLALIHDAFGALEIDPPSGALGETLETMSERLRTETLLIASSHEGLLGCLFCRRVVEDDSLYVGRMAVAAKVRSHGIGRGLLRAARSLAASLGVRAMTLRVRISLSSNVAFFRSQGFVIVAEGAHAGYCRPTFYDMRSGVDPG